MFSLQLPERTSIRVATNLWPIFKDPVHLDRTVMTTGGYSTRLATEFPAEQQYDLVMEFLDFIPRIK